MDVSQVVEAELESIGVLPHREQRVVVGVSGGGDSVCLMHVLQELRVPLVVAHFDHGLRRSSWADGRHVLRLAAKLGLPALAERLQPGELRADSGSLEERARRARYRFLASAAREWSCRVIAVGHTQDDQAETVLMHLLRGAGTRGLRGMRSACALQEITGDPDDADIQLIRPLLNVPREATLAYCRSRHLPIRRDPTNDQAAFFRNRVRLELLPFLEGYNPRIREALARTADILAGDAQAIESLTGLLGPESRHSASDDRVQVARHWVVGLPVGLQRTVLRKILHDLSGDRAEVGFRAVERARAALASGRRTSLPGGIELFSEGDTLVLSRAGVSEPPALEFPQLAGDDELLLRPWSTTALAGGWSLEVVEEDAAEAAGNLPADPRREVVFDARVLGPRLTLRAPVPGDRMTPFGAKGSKKVSDLLQQERIPVAARARWPVVRQGDSILWLVGIRRAEGARVGPRTRRVLRLRVRQGEG